MAKRVVIKKVAPNKSLDAAVKKSLSTIKRAIYRAKTNQPPNTI